jgi:hypothetical protein
VLELDARLAVPFAQVFPPPQFYLNPDSVQDAVARRSMFNLIDTTTGDKVDFWLLTFDAFDTARFARRKRVRLFGETVSVASPEDAILSKLRWAKFSGGSHKQLVDAVRIFEVQHDALDRSYLNEWVSRLAVQEEWNQLIAQASPF